MKTIEKILLLLFTVSTICCAASSSSPISVDLPRGWVQAKDDGAQSQHPTVKYVPSDGRNAEVLISIVGAVEGKLIEKSNLMEFHAMRCKPFLGNSAATYETHELKLAYGWALYSSFADPDLVGKPTMPGNYKYAAPVEMALDGSFVVYATIFTDEPDSATFKEALAILKTVKPDHAQDAEAVTTEVRGDSLIVFVPVLEAALSLPRKGFKEKTEKANPSKTYFYFSRNDGLLVSGWLDHSASYPGFSRFWASEKKKIQASAELKFEDEKIEEIGQWQTASYVIKPGQGLTQWDLRACCTSGDTWVDVHLSTTNESGGAESLKTALRSFSVGPRKPSNQLKGSAAKPDPSI